MALLLISLRKNSVTYYYRIYIPADTCAWGFHFPERPLFLCKTIPSICPLDFIPCGLLKDMLLFIHQLKKNQNKTKQNSIDDPLCPSFQISLHLFLPLEIKLCEVFV